MGPGQSGLAVAAGHTSRQAEGLVEHERRVRLLRSISNCIGSEN